MREAFAGTKLGDMCELKMNEDMGINEKECARHRTAMHLTQGYATMYGWNVEGEAAVN